MIVTDRDIVIADYSVRSFAKIEDVAFKLVVYSNWVRSDLKQRYFPGWRRLPFVEIWEDPLQTDDLKPQDRSLWGPFELGYVVWDRELRKLTDSPYHAIVDADFEVVDQRFVHVMLQRLQTEANLVAMSANYDPTRSNVYDSYTDRSIELVERWHTHFCIYKRSALACPVSYGLREEPLAGPVPARVWDDHAYFQQALRDQYGFKLAAVEPRYQRCFIHYGAFAENRHITEGNVAMYRWVKLLRHCGLWGLGDPITRLLGAVLDRLFFGHVDRSTFVEGWAQSKGQVSH
jgi:hypothetical protein